MLAWIKKNKDWLFSGVAVAVIGAVINHYWPAGNDSPLPPPDSSVHQTHSGKGDNVGGDKNVTTDNSIHQTNSGGGDNVAVSYNYNTSGIDPKLFAHYAGELAVTDAALTNFFRILDEQQVPRNDLDAKLREIAAAHKKLLAQVEAIQSKDPEVLRLKDEAKRAVETGHYANAIKLLKVMEERPLAFAFDLFIKGATPPPSADRR
ncbi:MAG: hypothetical protein Q3M24_06290 [Candidatus Electrothrix aestuarii]|uniref:Uncharacterized protein n=1 Tax=Candidatus Electrothrix aestuarii TaxID=3062594 RepID=A0AAU8LYK4_9BACT